MCMQAYTHFSARFHHFEELESFNSLQSSWDRVSPPALVLTPCCLEEPSWEDSLTPTAKPWWHTVLSYWLLDHRGPNLLSVMRQGCGAWWKNTVLIFGLALLLMWAEASRVLFGWWVRQTATASRRGALLLLDMFLPHPLLEIDLWYKI